MSYKNWCIALLCLSPATWAENVPQSSMLVLDASGSMWGQVEGKAKIGLARDAVSAMLDSWPATNSLGLMAYGHRTKGDCNDIEVLINADNTDVQAVRSAVAKLNPKGKTPITAAVRIAAEQLKFTEQKATVILVSDGEETCDADPCSLGTELDKLGVDFTAHVVGFDVGQNAKAQQQLKCLANNTGGQYFEADNAAELSKALNDVANEPAAPAPEPEPAREFDAGQVYMENIRIWPDGMTTDDASTKTFEQVNLVAEQTAQDCQKLCEADADCAAWMFEPTGAYFREHPVCNRWDKSPSLVKEADEGFVSGLKTGVKMLVKETGQ